MEERTPELPSTLRETYELESELGRGACGVVFLVRERATGARRALKLLTREGKEVVERFRREGQALLALDHPHLVRVIAADEDPEAPYLLCEYLEGGTLRVEIDGGRMKPDRAARVMSDLLVGLSACHQRGIVHRDVKPENILFDGNGRAKLADLGVARFTGAAGTALTAAGALIGTPRYMAPEQLRGEAAGPAADLFSAGVILHEMLAGQVPFDASTVYDLAGQHARQGIPPLPAGLSVPPALAHLRERLLEPLSSARPANAVVALELLSTPNVPQNPSGSRIPQVKLDPAPRAKSGPTPLPSRPGPPRRRAPALTLMLAAALGFAAIVFTLRPRPGPPAPPASVDAPDAAQALTSLIERTAPDALISWMVADPRWERDLDFPGLSGTFGFDTPVDTRTVRKRTPAGYFRDLLKPRLVASGVWPALERFRAIAPAYWAGPADLAHKLRTYAALLRLEPLDVAILAQFDAERLGVRETFAPLVERTFRLSDTVSDLPRGWSPVLRGASHWSTEDFNSFTVLSFWTGFSPELSHRLGWSKEMIRDPKSVLKQRRTGRIEVPASADRSDLLVIEAVVVLMGPGHFFDVALAPPGGETPFTVRFAHPGNAEWFSAMDDVTSMSNVTGEAIARGQLPRQIGVLRTFVPVWALPRGELEAHVTYRHLPGIPYKAQASVQRTATLVSLRARIEPVSPH